MIFVIFGTSPCPFERLARAVESLAVKREEEIVVQLGATATRPRGVSCLGFLSRPDLVATAAKADYIICHGGFATLADCLRLEKRIVAVPRRREYGETLDPGDGQMEIVRQLEEDGRLVGVDESLDLDAALVRASRILPRHEPNSRLPGLVRDFVCRVLNADREGETAVRAANPAQRGKEGRFNPSKEAEP